MSENRLRWVNAAFDKVDTAKSGRVSLETLTNTFDCRSHPEVMDGRRNADQVYRDFAGCWDFKEFDGFVSKAEFADYFEGISAAIERDDIFEQMMQRAWNMS